jgi:hypothetical protein
MLSEERHKSFRACPEDRIRNEEAEAERLVNAMLPFTWAETTTVQRKARQR